MGIGIIWNRLKWALIYDYKMVDTQNFNLAKFVDKIFKAFLIS